MKNAANSWQNSARKSDLQSEALFHRSLQRFKIAGSQSHNFQRIIKAVGALGAIGLNITNNLNFNRVMTF